MTSANGMGAATFFPGLVPGASISGEITIPDTGGSPLFSLLLHAGNQDINSVGALTTWTGVKSQAQSLATVPQVIATPMAVPFNMDWIKVFFDPGWNAGTFNFIGQGLPPGAPFFHQAFVEGTINSIRTVPEPSSLALMLLGACGLARYRKSRRQLARVE